MKSGASKYTSEPLEEHVLPQLERGVMPIAHEGDARDLLQPLADHITYIMKRLRDY